MNTNPCMDTQKLKEDEWGPALSLLLYPSETGSLTESGTKLTSSKPHPSITTTHTVWATVSRVAQPVFVCLLYLFS